MKTFAEILESRMQTTSDATQRMASHKAGPGRPGHLDLMISQLEIQLRLKPKVQADPLPLTKTPSPQASLKPEIWDPPHLSPSIKASFRFFHSNGEPRIREGSTLLDLKKAYRRLAKKLHPDRFALATAELRELQANEFRSLTEHHNTLSNFLRSKRPL